MQTNGLQFLFYIGIFCLIKIKINVDIILQSVGRDGTKDIAFTVAKDKIDDAKNVIDDFMPTLKAQNVIYDTETKGLPPEPE